jgi:hypothetical protein
MGTLLRLAVLLAVMAVGGVALIKILYDVSWDEAIEIADQFAQDLLA